VKIVIVTPAPARTLLGNRITALRWQRILRRLGHRVEIVRRWRAEACDLLVALHARKSAQSVRSFRARFAHVPIVVALTGTDVYAERGLDAVARSTLKRASRVVVLQREALHALDRSTRRRARVILQSATRFGGRVALPRRRFSVVAIGHLRAVKDPLLAARAARLLPASSRVRIEHYGSSLDARLARRARQESKENPRWCWRGERSHARTLRILARSHVFVQTSVAEGGSIAMSEAIVSGRPILSTRIPAAIGMLGREHRGFFETGDARALAELLIRCERDARFRRALCTASDRLAPLFAPACEQDAWRSLLAELGLGEPAPASRTEAPR
jgi:putative glycosyltransferase (TIGR04348 family)